MWKINQHFKLALTNQGPLCSMLALYPDEVKKPTGVNLLCIRSVASAVSELTAGNTDCKEVSPAVGLRSAWFSEKEFQFALECRAIGWFEQTHQFCNTNGLPINIINDIILTTMQEDGESKCNKLSVIICCKLSYHFPDFISC